TLRRSCNSECMTTSENLAEQIERVVRSHIEASRAVAEAALSRAFDAAVSSAKAKPKPKSPCRPTQTQGLQRRSEAEVTAASEQLYQAVCAAPGQSMAVLAATLGS